MNNDTVLTMHGVNVVMSVQRLRILPVKTVCVILKAKRVAEQKVSHNQSGGHEDTKS